jgi:hypothetical protein
MLLASSLSSSTIRSDFDPVRYGQNVNGKDLRPQPLLSPQMRLHEPNLTLISPSAKRQTHIPNGSHARFHSSFDDITVLLVAFGSVYLTATDKQEETDAFESRAESLRASEVEFAELHALGLVLGAVRWRARGGDDRGWVCKRWCRIVVPRPPVAPVRRIGRWEDIGVGVSRCGC